VNASNKQNYDNVAFCQPAAIRFFSVLEKKFQAPDLELGKRYGVTGLDQ